MASQHLAETPVTWADVQNRWFWHRPPYRPSRVNWKPSVVAWSSEVPSFCLGRRGRRRPARPLRRPSHPTTPRDALAAEWVTSLLRRRCSVAHAGRAQQKCNAYGCCPRQTCQWESASNQPACRTSTPTASARLHLHGSTNRSSTHPPRPPCRVVRDSLICRDPGARRSDRLGCGREARQRVVRKPQNIEIPTGRAPLAPATSRSMARRLSPRHRPRGGHRCRPHARLHRQSLAAAALKSAMGEHADPV